MQINYVCEGSELFRSFWCLMVEMRAEYIVKMLTTSLFELFVANTKVFMKV